MSKQPKHRFATGLDCILFKMAKTADFTVL